jgi:3'(2'), 5'-bisphosphate nucleotidase
MRAVQRDTPTAWVTKADTSPATVADFAIQAWLTRELSRSFPDPVVAEEDASVLELASAGDLRERVVAFARRLAPDLTADDVLAWIRRAGDPNGTRFWAIDPIDGTRGLLRGAQYATAVALLGAGAVQIGIVGCPRLGTRSTNGMPAAPKAVLQVEDDDLGGVAVAVRGLGAWWLPSEASELAPLKVSLVTDAAMARVVHSYESRHEDAEAVQSMFHRLGAVRAPVGIDSQAKHVLIAAGEADLLVRVPAETTYRDAIWDLAAGSLLIEEAGGRVTDLAGRSLDFTTGRHLLRNRGVVASNGWLHDAALAAIS